MQGAQDTIEILQSQILELEIKLNQAKASLADARFVNSQDTMKLQEQLRQAELKAASKLDSDSGLRALRLEVSQLRNDLHSQASDAAAATAASQEASLGSMVLSLQEKLQEAEAKTAADAELGSKIAETTQELSRVQSALSQAQAHTTQVEASAAEREEEHKAALQVTHLLQWFATL